MFLFEINQNSFSFGSPFGPYWSVKYVNFGQKLPIRTAHHTVLERLLKINTMFCPPRGAKYSFSSLTTNYLLLIHDWLFNYS